MNKVELELVENSNNLEFAQLKTGEVYIVVADPANKDFYKNEPVVKGRDELVFLKNLVYGNCASACKYRFRKLHSGEKIIISGENGE